MEEPFIADRYRLLDLIGSGGEARVFRAKDVKQGIEVAVRLPIDSEGEANAVPELEFHSGWVRLLDSGLDSNRVRYQVFELLRGATLHQKVQSARLSDDEWLTFIRQSLDAVEALHSAGWVHGDLNAENFIQVAASSSWKLLELPFFRSAPPHRSAMFGSIHTLAPEQLRGQAADSHSDLYALGCLYYYAAAGEYPHAGTTRQEVVISLLRFPPVPLREKEPARPFHLGDWVMRLLEPDPQTRYPSIAEARWSLPRFP